MFLRCKHSECLCSSNENALFYSVKYLFDTIYLQRMGSRGRDTEDGKERTGGRGWETEDENKKMDII